MTHTRSPLTRGAHHIGLTVPQLDVTRAFFVEVLGFSVVGEKPDYPAVFVHDGTVMITLWQAKDPATAVPFDRKQVIGLHHFALRVDDATALDQVYAHLREADGVTIEFAPEPMGAGNTRHLMCTIPGGIRMEIIAPDTPLPSPFHAGEQAVQTRVGVRERVEAGGRRMIRAAMPLEHREFFASLPFMVAAARDEQGRPWASLIAGAPGFVRSPSPHVLELAGGPVPGDALEGALRPGAELGLLGIEPSTRRRNRMNGRITAAHEAGLTVEVDQSFGNCPKHITERSWRIVEPPLAAPLRHRDRRLRPAWTEWIRRADTFFIASGHRGMDASHRGGPPGFVEVLDDRTLVIPDFAGNNFFNTLGNLALDPRAGLVWVDFATGGMLQLTGATTIDWDSPRVAAHPGARRLIVFELDEAIELEHALPLRWEATSG